MKTIETQKSSPPPGAQTPLGQMDIREIMALVPHRYPFILIDRVTELIPGQSIVALKNVSMNEGYFQGHFPGNPVMPGVLIIEAMAQACGVLMLKSLPPEKRGLLLFSGIDKTRLRRPAVPGDQLVIEGRILHLRNRASKMQGIVKSGKNVVAEGILMAVIGEDNDTFNGDY